ncbi:DUF3918 family protein [Bacillus marinisedimentorum]|uniref:DUF3918 family protein n=1 Tax=Bacillus marinisedimentorum TaxID=1821260 RepID=UPI0009F55EC9|nr:DUF3918 family protein [Bacillus marinisedimentorum]
MGKMIGSIAAMGLGAAAYRMMAEDGRGNRMANMMSSRPVKRFRKRLARSIY